MLAKGKGGGGTSRLSRVLAEALSVPPGPKANPLDCLSLAQFLLRGRPSWLHMCWPRGRVEGRGHMKGGRGTSRLSRVLPEAW